MHSFNGVDTKLLQELQLGARVPFARELIQGGGAPALRSAPSTFQCCQSTAYWGSWRGPMGLSTGKRRGWRSLLDDDVVRAIGRESRTPMCGEKAPEGSTVAVAVPSASRVLETTK